VPDQSKIAFRVEARRVRHVGSWWRQALEVAVLRSPSARPEYDTPPFAVVMCVASTGAVLVAFPAASRDEAAAIAARLEREAADTPDLNRFLDTYSVPASRRSPLR
jgi:hypothetical protein